MLMKVCGADKDCLEVEFHGPLDETEVKRFFREIAELAGKNKYRGVLVDGRGIEGIPGVMKTYEMVCGLEVLREKGMKVALLHDDEKFVNDRFAITVAENRMIKYNKFTDREKAMEWIGMAQ